MDQKLEAKLARKAQRGDHAALAELILPFVGWVTKEARRYSTPSVHTEDLAQEGVLALLTAARKFDTTRGLHFSTYAKWWIRAFLVKHLDRNRRTLVPPGTRLARKVRQQLRRVESRFEAEHGRSATVEELAALFSTTPEKFEDVREAFHGYDYRLGEEVGQYDPVESKTAHDELADAEARRATAELSAIALDALSLRDRAIIEARIMADPEDQKTYQELADEYGISKERVRQLEDKALRRMRRRLRELVKEKRRAARRAKKKPRRVAARRNGRLRAEAA